MIKKAPNTALKAKPTNPIADISNILGPAPPTIANDDPIINDDMIKATDS